MKTVLSITVILILLAATTASQRDSELSGFVRYQNNTAARGVVLSIGNFNVTTDVNGYYKMGYVKPGVKTVWVTPPGKQARSFQVQIDANPTRRDFTVNW